MKPSDWFWIVTWPTSANENGWIPVQCKFTLFFAHSTLIKLAYPQAAQLSLFLSKVSYHWTSKRGLFKDIPLIGWKEKEPGAHRNQTRYFETRCHPSTTCASPAPLPSENIYTLNFFIENYWLYLFHRNVTSSFNFWSAFVGRTRTWDKT